MPSTTASRALATAIWPDTVNRTAQAIVLVLAGTAILAISARVSVPFWPVPLTLQTLAVLLIGAAYGSRLGVATLIAYIAEGLVGLAGLRRRRRRAGPAYLLGPTAGFIMSWVLVAAIVGYAADRGWDRSPLRLGVAMLLAVVVQFAMGFAWLAWFAHLSNGATGTGAAYAWAKGVAPFLLGDALKVVLAALLIPASWTLVSRK